MIEYGSAIWFDWVTHRVGDLGIYYVKVSRSNKVTHCIGEIRTLNKQKNPCLAAWFFVGVV